MGIDLADLPGGLFRMGADDAPHPEDGEGPVRPVRLSPYRIGVTTVTNSEFAEFVDATGFRTAAETAGYSWVFAGQLEQPDSYPAVDPALPWWRRVEGANWRFPDGRQAAADDLPVVHVSLDDAAAFCHWAGVRLPTEAEWENAAGGEMDGAPHIFAGRFPDQPARAPYPHPAHQGPRNDKGLVHPCGNVWEWTADRFTRLHGPREVMNPKGPLNGERYVVKGGSYLCCTSYCARFRPSSRRGELPGMTTGHTGFRVAADAN